MAGTSHADGDSHRRAGAAFTLMAIALTLLAGCTRPTHDPAALKAISAESQSLMVTRPTTTYVAVPKSQWPHFVASLEPEAVTVYPDGLGIRMKAEFDDSWGYFIPRGVRKQPQNPGRFSDLGQGVYWYDPNSEF